LDVIWIGDGGVAGEEFVPAGAAAEMAAGEFPERITGLDADFGAAEIIHSGSNRRVVGDERRQHGNRFGWKQQFWRSGWRRGVDSGSVRRYVGKRECRFRGRGQVW